MTNAEKIKQRVKNMTNSELADYIIQQGSQCDHCVYDSYTCSEEDCQFGVETWLKKKVEDKNE